MRQLPAPPFGVFTRVQLADLGWTDSAVRQALKTGRIKRVRAGVYWVVHPLPADDFARARYWLRVQAIAAGLCTPGAIITHTAAAALYDLPILTTPDHPCLTITDRRLNTLRQAHLHHAPVPDLQRRHVRGLIVASPARTVADIAREQGVRAGLVSADAALAARLCTRTNLTEAAEFSRRWNHGANALEVARFADSLAESPLESLSRYALRDLVPAPRLQVNLLNHSGEFLGRADFFWEEFGVVGEVDGMSKYVERSVLRQEKLRQERLERASLIVVRWGAQDLRQIDRLAARINQACARQRSTSAGWIAQAA